MIDTHAHITSEFYDDIDSVVKELKEKNVELVINAGDNIASSKEVIELSKKYKGFLYPAVGIHPESVEEIDKIQEIEDLIKNNKVYAIGEIGLDYYYSKENKEKQLKLFNKQLDLAEKYNLPIIVHTRDAVSDTLNELKKRNLKGIIHCFNESYEMAKEFIKLGYKLGMGGVLTFKNSKTYLLIEKLGLENFVLETDSPFLAPEPLRGTKNIPSNVYYVAKKISEIKNISLEEVIKITSENAHELF